VVHLITRWFGVFLCDDGKIVDKRLFPKNADEIAERLYKIQKGEVLEEEREFSSYNPYVSTPRLRSIGKLSENGRIRIGYGEYGYTIEMLRDACIKVAEKRIKEEGLERHRRIAEAIHALDDIIKMENIIMERLSSWYGFFGKFKDIEDVKNIKIGDEEIDRMERNAIRKMVKIFDELEDAKKMLDEYIEQAMKEIAPNVSKIVGHKIAARLVAMAGGIDKLAMMPAGTIQLLGAEKALFRHIKDGSLPPKHGIIFMHELVNKAPKKKRGKIARMLATKISMAAKADAFTHNEIADELMKEIEQRYEEIMKGGAKY